MNKQATLFWGRMKTIMYPDGEDLTYSYDNGGQLKSMHGTKDGFNYTYIADMLYDKFGVKTYMGYGNRYAIDGDYSVNHIYLGSKDSVDQENIIKDDSNKIITGIKVLKNK